MGLPASFEGSDQLSTIIFILQVQGILSSIRDHRNKK